MLIYLDIYLNLDFYLILFFKFQMDEIFKDLDFIMNECKIPLQLLCKKCERIAVLKVVIELFLEKIDFALSDGLGAYSDFLKEEVEKVTK